MFYSQINDGFILQITKEHLLSLTPREEKVIKMLFGLFGQDAVTYSDIAKHFEVSELRAKQIIERAERKLIFYVTGVKIPFNERIKVK